MSLLLLSFRLLSDQNLCWRVPEVDSERECLCACVRCVTLHFIIIAIFILFRFILHFTFFMRVFFFPVVVVVVSFSVAFLRTSAMLNWNWFFFGVHNFCQHYRRFSSSSLFRHILHSHLDLHSKYSLVLVAIAVVVDGLSQMLLLYMLGVSTSFIVQARTVLVFHFFFFIYFHFFHPFFLFVIFFELALGLCVCVLFLFTSSFCFAGNIGGMGCSDNVLSCLLECFAVTRRIHLCFYNSFLSFLFFLTIHCAHFCSSNI